MKGLCRSGLLAIVLYSVALAQSVPDTVEGHRAAAKAAAGSDLTGLRESDGV